MKLLHIDSSILGEKSVSRKLTREVADRLKALNPALETVYYDLDKTPFAFLSSAAFADSKQQAIGAKALEDFLGADILVIGAPMYNFGIPAQLKAWIDRIAVAGKTFRYTENGSVGLADGKKVYVVSTRGGIYSGDASTLDHQESYLKTVFAFMGVIDVEIIRAEGVNLGPDSAAKAIAGAQALIPAIDSKLKE